ncbi:MAG: hypothetical protein A2W85_16590 [Bacteroidetes bacterium GWF2_41_31]|nr:MAG: hypothetical protein A2W85_16590 [Bacteroidetes bacterium GWF2_41_31]OFZ09765.1 MAG: hypothetical protein A2338_00445 [Bacteroidetes bacterium RIFOXYB12_FULL_41_6]
MKMKSLALGLMLLFFAGMTSSAIASVVNYENGVTVTKVDDDKDKDKKKSKAKCADMKSCGDKKSCCSSKAVDPACNDKKVGAETKPASETKADPDKK